MSDQRLHAKAEVAGLGILALPELHEVYRYGRAKMRSPAAAHALEAVGHAPTWKTAVELGGLGVLAAPSIETLLKKPRVPHLKNASMSPAQMVDAMGDRIWDAELLTGILKAASAAERCGSVSVSMLRSPKDAAHAGPRRRKMLKKDDGREHETETM